MSEVPIPIGVASKRMQRALPPAQTRKSQPGEVECDFVNGSTSTMRTAILLATDNHWHHVRLPNGFKVGLGVSTWKITARRVIE